MESSVFVIYGEKKMKKRILIIDDDFTNCKHLSKTLKKYNYEVAFEFKFLPEWYFKKFEGFDLILCNAEFPELNKSDFISCISSLNFEIPFLLMIEKQHISLMKNYIDEGVDDFLYLPFDLFKIQSVIDKNIILKKNELKRKKDITQETLLKLLIPLMRALDAKDNYTIEHTQKVAALSMKIADKLKLTENEKMILQISAYFHDIGKIGMPDNILQKSGPLHDEEFMQIKSHPVIGSDIIGEIEELREVAKIIRHHHEKYDGSGYPDGLKGEEIPYFSRILTIADIYDALTSRRVYKNEISKQQVLSEMQKNSGIQFDPYLLQVFLDITEDDENFDIVTDPIFSEILFDKSFCRTDFVSAKY